VASITSLERLAAALNAALQAGAVQANQPLARHTTLRVGGPADLLVEATTLSTLEQAVRLAAEAGVPCRVLGAGANVLVSDAGVRGLVVLNRARSVSFSAGGVRAESGATLARVARRCVSRGLAGLEWAVGIPGTIGGAVVGNAGAWGGDVASSLLSAMVLDAEGTVAEWPVGRFGYDYRMSALKCQPPVAGVRAVVLAASFLLRAADRSALEARVADVQARRRMTQPTGASCGSVFRNPPGDYAGRLIEAAGLKGARSGGAQISPVHANFIINLGHMSAADIKALIDRASQEVQSRFGVQLELEIELMGDW
jgi:UDP-N-acetylmuramate dehydrogenase